MLSEKAIISKCILFVLDYSLCYFAPHRCGCRHWMVLFVKIIKQHDEYDCGAACLAMIANCYGSHLPISEFRDLTKTDRNGVNLYGMIDGANRIGLAAEALCGTIEDLLSGIENNEIEFPFVAHITNDVGMLHFVVVYKYKKEKFYIADPGVGKYAVSKNDFPEIWNGYIITYKKGKGFKQIKIKGHKTQKIFSLLKGEYSKILLILLASIIIAAIGIAGAFVFQTVIDSLNMGFSNEVVSHASEDAGVVGKITMLISDSGENFNNFFLTLLFAYMFQTIIQFFRGWLMASFTKELDMKLVLNFYNHVVDMPISKILARNTGEYLSRYSDIAIIRNAISSSTITFVMDSTMVVACGIILYRQNSLLFTISLTVVILYAVIVVCYKKPIDKTNRNVMENNAKVESFFKETIDGVETIKANQAEDLVKTKNNNKYMKLIKSVYKNCIVSYSQDSLCNMVDLSGVLLILWIGFTMVKQNVVSLGSLMSFYALLSYFAMPIKNIIELQPMIQSAIIAGDRLDDVLEENKENNEKSSECIDFKKIEFSNVDFRYGNRSRVLDKISFSFSRGERIAIVGESGSGKTTIAKLLLRFYDVENGNILINGVGINDYDIGSIRKSLAYIDQRTFLFSDTIINNLKIGNPDATDDEIVEVCKVAQCHNFIEKQPLKYNTYLEENGMNLSGGQRQRLAIARALLKKPQILILDEATSNLDTLTEMSIHDSLFDYNKNLSCVIIAHRLSTVKKCDRIYVVENGSIVESGTHSELLGMNGVYSKFYEKLN